MKFSLALATVLSALASANKFTPANESSNNNNDKSAFVSKLMCGAKVTTNSQLRSHKRKLDEDEYVADISGYSLKFERGQFVEAYNGELIDEDEEDSANTIPGTKRFVVFRLCPDNLCSTCNNNYREYVIDLETYLQATVEFQQELHKDMCDACGECENNQENGDDCESCYDECMKIENMEENGYIDATEFLYCQMIYDPDPWDDGKAALYAGSVRQPGSPDQDWCFH